MPSSGPTFTPSAQAQARLPQPPAGWRKGRFAGSAGAAVNNPTKGPAFRQATSPARCRIPQRPSGGRIWSNAGTYATALLTNTFEGGTSGTTVSAGNSGGTSGNPFDLVTIGASATDAFDNAHAAHGALSNKIATGGSSVAVYNTWSLSLTNTGVPQAWFRVYLYFTGNPGTAHRVFAAYSGGQVAASLSVNTSGFLVLADQSGSAIYTTATAIPANAWFRVEGYVVGNGEGAGQVALNLYTVPDSAAPAETYTSAATQNTRGLITDVRWGISVAAATNLGPFWMDDIGVSVTGYLGPFLVGGTGGSSSISMGQAVILPGTTATSLFPVPPGLVSVTFYNLSAATAWIGTSTATTSANGLNCHSVPTNFTTYTGSKGGQFYGTTGSTAPTSVATIQYIIVSAH